MKKILLIGMLLLLVISCLGCTANPSDNVKLPDDDEDENENSQSIPEWAEYTFRYDSQTDPTLNLFIDWIRSGGTKEINMKNYSEYSYNRPFLDWVKEREDLVLPSVKDNDFRFYDVRIATDSIAYIFNFSDYKPNAQIIKTFDVRLFYLNEEQRQKGLFNRLIESGYKEEKLHKGEGECPWGEYWYINYEEDDKGEIIPLTIAFFLYGDFQVMIIPYGTIQKTPWNPEYFNYFDFETVPLK